MRSYSFCACLCLWHGVVIVLFGLGRNEFRMIPKFPCALRGSIENSFSCILRLCQDS